MRRYIAVGALALTVAACAAQTPAQVGADVALIAQGLNNAIPLLTAPAANPGLDAATAAKVKGYIGDIQAAATAFTVADTATAQQQLVTRIAMDVEQIATSIQASGQPLPVPFAPYLAAAEALLPAIEVAFGATAPAATTSAHHYAMSPEMARAILKGAHR